MLRVEYISPDGQLLESLELADGQSIHQAACTLFPDSGGKFPAPVIAIVGDRPAVRELGDWDFKLSGASVQFRALAMGGGGGGGGGSNTMQVVMQVAVIALAAAATWYLGGSGGVLVGAGWSLGAANFAAGLVSTGIMMLGTMLMGALFKNKMNMPTGQLAASNAAAASPTYSINASGNQARLYQPEPEGFGRMKIVPDFVAQTWTQYISNDQIGYFVYSLGRGEYEVESLQFGETVFWRDGNLIESAYVDDWQAWSQPVNLALPALAGQSAAFAATDAADTARELTATLHFPQGLCTWAWVAGYWKRYSDYDYETGQSSSYREWRPGYWRAVNHSIRLRVWLREVDTNGVAGDWQDMGVQTFSAAQTTAFSRSFTLTAPNFGRWELALENETAELPDVTARDYANGYGDSLTTYTASPRQTVNWTEVGSNRASISWQILKPGDAVTIFPDNVVTSDEVSGQELFAPNEEEYDGALGPYVACPAGTVTDRLLFDFVLQQGLGYYDDQGSLRNYTVRWDIEAQRIDDLGNALEDWQTLEAISKSGATLTPQRMTLTYEVPEGRYQCRVRRTSNTRGDGRTMDSLVWGAMRAILPGTLSYPQSCIAFSIKASNVLTQAASSKFSVIATRKLPLYDRASKTWSEPVPTRSWAAAVSHVARCDWGGQLADSNIDLETLWAIDEKLQARGWHYDAYLDGPYLVWDLIGEMCQSQTVIPRLLGPVLSFVLDEDERLPSFALTPRNIMRGTFAVNYVTWSDDTPDDVVVDYLDADYGFQQRDVTATLPESESREPTSLSILGITSRAHAHAVAVAYAAHNRWQRISVECQVEALGRLINVGDVVSVAHPRFRNTASGAVSGWDEAELRLDLLRDTGRILPESVAPDVADAPDAADAGIWLGLTRQDGSVWGPCRLASVEGASVRLDSADYSTLLLQGAGNPFEWLTTGQDRQPTAWTLYLGQNYQRLMIIESVTTQDALHFSLKLSNYDPRIYQYADLPVPPWQGRQQLPTSASMEAPANLRGIVMAETVLLVVWAIVPGAEWYEVQTSPDGQSWTDRGRVNVTQMEVTVAPGPIWLRVRAASSELVSAWAQWISDTTVPVPLAPVPELSGSYTGGEASVIWPAVENALRYAVSVQVEGQPVYTASLTGPAFSLTPEMQEGGPYRELTVNVASVGVNGTSPEASLALADPAPPEVTAVEVSTAAGSVTLESVTLAADGEDAADNGTDRTGFVLLRGLTADFAPTAALESRRAEALPCTWSGLAAGAQYFRVALTDAFYDIARDPASLNWSDVLTVEVVDG